MGDVSIEWFIPGNAEHRRAFAELNREWLSNYFEAEPLDEAMFANPEGLLEERDGMIAFARMDGTIVGTGSLLKREAGVDEIAKMAVSTTCRGKGIGRKLAEALIARAKARGARKLYIASNRKLEAALALYYDLGFKETALADTRYARCDITLEMPLAGESGGRGGLDPTRYGDWEVGGKCVDF